MHSLIGFCIYQELTGFIYLYNDQTVNFSEIQAMEIPEMKYACDFAYALRHFSNNDKHGSLEKNSINIDIFNVKI